MVGCLWCTYPSIHFFVSRSRSVVDPSIHKNSQDHGRLPAVHKTKHSPFSWCWNSQDHGRLPDKHISKHSQQKLVDMLDSLVQETRGLCARPPVLTPVPSQAIHSRACLNLHHSDIQGTAQKSPCVNTFEAIVKKKKKQNINLLVTVWEPGQDTRNKDNGHVRQQRAQCDMMMVVFFR